jgi:hypothetical protein
MTTINSEAIAGRVRAIFAAFWLCSLLAMAPAQSFPAAASAEATSPETIETVEVEARREALRKAVREFVMRATVSDGDNLARWRYPICLSISGASPEQAEFVRGRIQEIAEMAGLRTDRRPKCRPNFFLVLTDDAAALLETWRARNPAMFGSESPQVAGSVPPARPVRAWHGGTLNNADGSAPIPNAISPAGPSQYRLVDSHIKNTVAEDMTSVIVLVDTSATGQATFGQLADYIAMVGLARIDANADFADAPTILRLFGPSDAPKSLTPWDQAFLKALYEPNDPLLRQRSAVTTSMAEELVP